MQTLFTQKKAQEMENHNANHDEVNGQITQCLEMYILTYAHLTLTNVSVLKISLLNLVALIVCKPQPLKKLVHAQRVWKRSNYFKMWEGSYEL
jgi:hypothetical protein